MNSSRTFVVLIALVACVAVQAMNPVRHSPFPFRFMEAKKKYAACFPKIIAKAKTLKNLGDKILAAAELLTESKAQVWRDEMKNKTEPSGKSTLGVIPGLPVVTKFGVGLESHCFLQLGFFLNVCFILLFFSFLGVGIMYANLTTDALKANRLHHVASWFLVMHFLFSVSFSVSFSTWSFSHY